jgi:predicted CoA-binding protein
MKMKSSYKTLVLGASLKPYRYSHRAVKILKLNGYEVVPIGLREGEIEGIKILTGQPELENIHTVTLYMNAQRQKAVYDYILSLKPKRIIFNPGAENPELYKLATTNGIYCENACTLVMLSTKDYEQIHSVKSN